MRILVVEDSPEYLSVAKEVFGDAEVVYATTYEEALAVLESREIEGVITDLFFPSQNDWRGPLGLSRGENPSGVGILRWCVEHHTTCVIVSQANRHEKAGLAVAEASAGAQWIVDAVGNEFREEFPWMVEKTPLKAFMLYGTAYFEPDEKGCIKMVRKDQKETWLDALALVGAAEAVR